MARVIDYRIGTAGQSNMQGWDNGSGFTTPSSETWLFKTADAKFTETYASMLPNLTKAMQSYYTGLSISFSRTEVGSTGVVDVWSVNSSATYIAAKNKYLAAPIDMILYFGGESDIAAGKTANEFTTAFRLMMSNFRTDLSKPNLPFYVIKPYVSAYTEAQNNEIRDSLDALEASDEIVIVGDALPYQDGLIDATHLNRASQDLLGTAVGDLLAPAISYNEYITPIVVNGYDTTDVIYDIIPNAESAFKTADARSGFCSVFNANFSTSPLSLKIVSTFPEGYGFKTKTAEDDAHYAFHSTTLYLIQSQHLATVLAQRSTLSIIAEIYMNATTDQIDIIDCRDALNNNIIFASVGGVFYVLLNYAGSPSTIAQFNIEGNITAKQRTFVGFTYNGEGATNADKLKIYVNGVEKTLTFTGTLPSTTPNVGLSSSTLKMYGTTATKLYGASVKSVAMSQAYHAAIASRGYDFDGIIGVYNNRDGTMELTALSHDVVSTSNRRESKYFKSFNSFMSWSKRKLNRR